MIDVNVLKYYYKNVENRNEFIKPMFIRLIKLMIIDKNTKDFLKKGFKWYSSMNQTLVDVPCNDSNWNEYTTFKEGLELGVTTIPLTLKMEHNVFNRFTSKEEFYDFYKKVIEFRIDTIKRGWAIKCGLTYSDIEYDDLDSLSEQQLLEWKDPRPGAEHSLDKLTEKDILSF